MLTIARPSATLDKKQIRRAYSKLSKLRHPDKGGSKKSLSKPLKCLSSFDKWFVPILSYKPSETAGSKPSSSGAPKKESASPSSSSQQDRRRTSASSHPGGRASPGHHSQYQQEYRQERQKQQQQEYRHEQQKRYQQQQEADGFYSDAEDTRTWGDKYFHFFSSSMEFKV